MNILHDILTGDTRLLPGHFAAPPPPPPIRSMRAGVVTRALLACALAVFAAQAQAQYGISKITGTSLTLANAPASGGAAAYTWQLPREIGGAEHDGNILHVRVKPEPEVVWEEDDGFTRDINDLPVGVGVVGITLNPSFSGMVLGLDATSLMLRGLQGGLTYQVRIRGDEAESELGPWSDVSEIAIPAAPTGLSASRSDNTISARWTAVAGATGYKIRWARNGQDWINDAGAAGETASGATSHEITNLESGRNYNIQVAAVTTAGPGAWSASINQSGKVLSADAALSGLVITDENGADLGIAFDPAFAPGSAATEPYTLEVANAIAAVKVRASATDPFSITISAANRHTRTVASLAPSVVANRALSPSIPLTAGKFKYAVIRIAVVAEDGGATSIYLIHLTRLSNDATLAQLFALNRIKVGTLTPAFAPGDPAKLDYRVEVPNDLASVEVAAVVTGVDDVVIANIRFVSDGMQHLPNTFTQLGDQGSAVSPMLPLSVGVAHVVMIIIPAHDLTTLTYTLTIVRLGSGNADSSLSDLEIAHGGGAAELRKVGGSGGFASAHLAYAASVESSIGSVTITPAAGNANAAITIGKRFEPASTVTSGNAHTQALAFGENTLDIIVTAENGSQRIYTLMLTRTPQSIDATLQSLSLSAGMLSPDFAPGDASYTARVANDITAITLTPTVNEAHARVSVGGASVASGQASAPQSLDVGANDIEIVVTAESGASMTYVVSVTRLPSVASANANLSALTTSAGALSPNFIADTFTYAVSAGNTVASVTITPTVADTGKASVTVDGTAVTSGQASDAIDLEVNVAKEILVVVTAEDGVAMKTYTLSVTRALSSDNTLSGLTLSAGALDPLFAATTLAYSVMVAHAVTAITLTPAVTQPDASVTVGGGAPDAAQMLSVGGNTIEIVVTAQNAATKTYTLTVTRAKSPDATLRTLQLSDGTLAPNFGPDTVSYTASVPNRTASITITPETTHADASVTVAGGAANSAQSLAIGDNTILIVVTAADELATKTYTLSVTRAEAMASSDSSLSGLSITPGALAENFAAATLTYTAALANSVESITITPALNEANATVTIDGSPVAAGQPSQAIALVANVQKTILLIVTAQDATAKTTYTLRITRAAGTPGLPQNLMASGGAAKLRVTWDAPADENGSAVTGYKIRWKLATATDFSDAVAVSGTAHSILGLAAGDYQAQILAVNGEGDGGYSDSARATAAAYGLDVNESGGRPGASDGILLARYLLGVRGAGLIDGQGENAGTVEDNVQNGIDLGLLDIDGDGDTDGTDGILLARHLLGLRGDALTGNLGLDAAAKVKVVENLAKFGR